jgi:hypothetical protein
MNQEITDLDLYRCHRITKTIYKDLEECRKVCDYAQRYQKLQEA